MHQKLEFPLGLDSYQGEEPAEYQRLRFQNYFPVSQKLRTDSEIIPISTDCAQLEQETKKKMQQFSLESLYEEGKLNIYPKKNTIDLKNHLSKKMQKIDKKTEKAIVQIAIQLLKKKEEGRSKESS